MSDRRSHRQQSIVCAPEITHHVYFHLRGLATPSPIGLLRNSHPPRKKNNPVTTRPIGRPKKSTVNKHPRHAPHKTWCPLSTREWWWRAVDTKTPCDEDETRRRDRATVRGMWSSSGLTEGVVFRWVIASERIPAAGRVYVAGCMCERAGINTMQFKEDVTVWAERRIFQLCNRRRLRFATPRSAFLPISQHGFAFVFRVGANSAAWRSACVFPHSSVPWTWRDGGCTALSARKTGLSTWWSATTTTWVSCGCVLAVSGWHVCKSVLWVTKSRSDLQNVRNVE